MANVMVEIWDSFSSVLVLMYQHSKPVPCKWLWILNWSRHNINRRHDIPTQILLTILLFNWSLFKVLIESLQYNSHQRDLNHLRQIDIFRKIEMAIKGKRISKIWVRKSTNIHLLC